MCVGAGGRLGGVVVGKVEWQSIGRGSGVTEYGVAECRSVGGGWLACWCEVVGGAKGGVAECRVGGEG